MALIHAFSLSQNFSLPHKLPKYPIKRSPLPDHKYGQFRRFASIQTSHLQVERQSANYQPSFWSYDFLQSLNSDYADQRYKDSAKKLEEDVRSMITNENADLLATLELIDDLQRLGLGYRFERDIIRALDNFASSKFCDERIQKSLHATALSFRLLRQQGYQVSQDVFNSFKDHSGNFKECLSKDVKGMLSLYEASYLAFEGENILEEARAFTRMHLKDLKGNVSKSMAEQVSHAFEVPLHCRMLRLEARWYIEAYNKREGANSLILELAKLDFNIVQSVFQRELKDMSRWWEEMGLANNLSFIRDRLMECFFWAVGIAFEPQLSNFRKGLTKVAALVTTIDDVYDVYGTLDELELFTYAVERWDVNAVKNLPHHMKLCFLALYNTVNEMVYDTLKEKGENILPYLTKAWADLCKAFLQEAKWCYNKDMPIFKDYLDNGWVSVSGAVFIVHAYFFLNQKFTKQALEGLEKYHDLLRLPSIIFRLCNDLSTSAGELKRGETANSIHCYMRETGVSEEAAEKHIHNMIDRTWKKMNEERVVDSPFGEGLVVTAINLARIAQCTYQYGDGHGAPDVKAKNRIVLVIIEPV
ncbi:tricyclene synthase TPS4, chloroplastic-like [Alnus glutinosa]|uniref:tricyclene synthase TPS4, chloroplastic-like n=1 Tax=Alnus glutinosa TaxID=3517 RepID=UPI002D78BF51|nr:tricyclene synthase TPS4, chloroplastic-like [Alnus glutinosa]